MTVALVPEGLLPTVTLSLAIGAQRMARPARARPPAGVGRDPRIDDVHLHRQDRDPDPQRDDRGRGVDARRRGAHRRRRLRARRRRSTATRRAARRAARRLRASSPRGARRAAPSEREGRWVAQGDPMEAALDALARRPASTSTPTSAAEPESAASRSTLAAGACRSWRRRPAARQRRARRGAPALRARRRSATPASPTMAEQGLRVLAVAHRDTGVDVPAAHRRRRRARPDAPRARRARGPAAGERRGRHRRVPPRRHADRDGHRRPPGDRRGDRRARSACSVTRAMVVEGTTFPTTSRSLGALVDRDGIVLARVDARGQAAHRAGAAGRAATSSR